MRSFSNLWFWIALAALWSTASHWVMGVPWDMVMRARRRGNTHQQDVEDLARIYANRMLYIGRTAGSWLIGLLAATLSALWVLGFWYGVHFCQALFLLGLPMTLVGWLSHGVALRIEAGQNQGIALYRLLRNHRMKVQGIGMLAILITAMWGMYQNLSASVMGY